MQANKMDYLNVEDLIARIEELESACATALRVNKHLNVEVETYVQDLEKSKQEAEAWRRHARKLAQQLDALRKEVGQGQGHSEEERLAEIIERQNDSVMEDDEQPSTSGLPMQLSDAQSKLLHQLIVRGKVAGWLIQPDQIQVGEVLGQGAFGTTYEATWHGSKVAVKFVRLAKASELTNCLREVESWSMIRHPHVVPFLGACLQLPDKLWLVTEYMSGGTLHQWLYPYSTNTNSFTRKPFLARLEKAYEVAQGLQVLDSCSPPVMHRDVKPSNVFIDSAGKARVGDFGLARRLVPEERAQLTGETGTYQYMAPEMIRHEVYDAKADVWSWGVLLVELLTGELPYAHTYLTPVQIALAVAEEQLQPAVPSDVDPGLQALALMACSYDPGMRPSFSLITNELEPLVKRLRQQGSQRPSMLGALQRSLTSQWSRVFGGIYGGSGSSAVAAAKDGGGSSGGPAAAAATAAATAGQVAASS